MDKMLRKRNCGENSCGDTSIISLDQQDLCLNHFLLRCYEKLEGVDPRGRKTGAFAADPASLQAFIEECSRKALDVSIRCENLDNLQRARLLDIMLWAGELYVLLRAPKSALADSGLC
jgi:hypothetical protein